jgi:hypothetical protein
MPKVSVEELKQFFVEHPLHFVSMRSLVSYFGVPAEDIDIALAELMANGYVERGFRLFDCRQTRILSGNEMP